MKAHLKNFRLKQYPKAEGQKTFNIFASVKYSLYRLLSSVLRTITDEPGQVSVPLRERGLM